MTAREWYAIYLPAKASPELQRRAALAVQSALADPDVLAGLKQAGVEPMSSTPAELTKLLEVDTNEWRRLTKEVGFTAES